MTDIVERLAGPFMAEPAAQRVMYKAADEITALRAEVERLTSLLERAVSRGCNHCMPVIGPIRKELEGE